MAATRLINSGSLALTLGVDLQWTEAVEVPYHHVSLYKLEYDIGFRF